MKPIDPSVLKALDFKKAAATEAGAWRNLLPPEPWLDIVRQHPAKFGAYAQHRLEAGISNAPSVISRARKPHQQTRPVAVVGIPERIAYRALCDSMLQTITPVDRSQGAYRDFVGGPIASALRGRKISFSKLRKQYVVESDIAAFYEYVDHFRLLREMQLRTSTVDIPGHLVGLLTEIQGRPFGLPQLLDPSDELSEVYARIIERELRRRGHEVWRYNDDFRLMADTYEVAQAKVEALAEEASALGLVLNERKTRVVKLLTYFKKNWAEEPTNGDVEFRPELLRIGSDYGVLDEKGLAELGCTTIDRLAAAPDEADHLDLSAASPEDSHALGRAISIFTKLSDPYALPHMVEVFEYLPHLSHRVGTYLVALSAKGTDVGPTWDALTAKSDVFNAWQRVWLVYMGRVAGILQDAKRQDWVQHQRADSDPLLRAEATLALAPHNGVGFDEADVAIRVEPEALIPWYALAASAVPGVDKRRLQALKDSHRLVDLVLTPPHTATP